MKILIDSNIILDVLLCREEHFDASKSMLDLSASAYTGFLTIYQTRDIFYIIRRNGLSAAEAKESVRLLATKLHMLNTEISDMANALDSSMTDYEDALLAYCANRHGMDFIVSRNVKDFANSPVRAISPVDFVQSIASAPTKIASDEDE